MDAILIARQSKAGTAQVTLQMDQNAMKFVETCLELDSKFVK